MKTILGLFFAQYWPMLTIALFYQTRMFIDKVILSGIDVGMVAAFYYARFIVETPATTVGLAIQRMYLPVSANWQRNVTAGNWVVNSGCC